MNKTLGETEQTEVIDYLQTLSMDETLELQVTLLKQLHQLDFKENIHDVSIAKKLDKCPYCGGNHIIKAGFNHDRDQRYRCTSCTRRFFWKTNTLTHFSKLSLEQWYIIFQNVLDNKTITRISQEAKISRKCAFYNKHKILYICDKLMNRVVLKDTVTLDETLISYIENGFEVETTINKAGETKRKRGMSNNQINITCAIDSSNNIIVQVADRGRVTAKTLISIYNNMIEHGSIIVSDSLRSYHKLMIELTANWKKIPSKKKEIEGYTLEPVNGLHREIKKYLYGKQGVSTKFLQGYLGLFALRYRNPDYYEQNCFFGLFHELNVPLSGMRQSDIAHPWSVYHTYYKSTASRLG